MPQSCRENHTLFKKKKSFPLWLGGLFYEYQRDAVYSWLEVSTYPHLIFWEKSIDISNYSCRSVCFTFHSCEFLLHAFITFLDKFMFNIVISSCWKNILIMQYPYLLLLIFFALKSTLLDINKLPQLSFRVFSCNALFPFLTFNPSRSWLLFADLEFHSIQNTTHISWKLSSMWRARKISTQRKKSTVATNTKPIQSNGEGRVFKQVSSKCIMNELG